MQQNPQEQLISSSSLIWKRWRCSLADELHTEGPSEGVNYKSSVSTSGEVYGLERFELLPTMSCFLRCVLLHV